MNRVLILVLFASFLGTACLAQGGPPLRTDDPGTPGSRNWEINAAGTVEARSGVTGTELPIVDINYGWGNHIQLKLEMPVLVQFDSSGTRAEAGDVKCGVKWRFVDQEKHGINISMYPQVSFNSPGPVRLVSDGAQLLLPLEFSRSWGKFALNAEGGVNLLQNANNELVLGLAAGYQATPKLELLGELHSNPLTSFTANDSVFQVGARRKLTNHYGFIFALGRGLPGSTAGPGFVGYFGLQFLFEHK
jgi:hypothetical protein